MRVLIAGGSGLIGGALVASLARDGHEAVVLSRRPAAVRGLPAGARAAGWDGRTLGAWVDEVAAADAVVQLAGESVFARWTAKRKRAIRESRVGPSRLVAEAIAAAPRHPRVLLQGAAIGVYGDCGDQPVDESTPPGDDFLSGVSREWEAASASVAALGVRRPIARTGIVLSPHGGAFPLMRLPFRFFAGGPLGRGRQWLPWIHEHDEVGALRFLLDHPEADGPYNLVAPEPVTQRDFSRELGRSLRRPSWLPVPPLAVKLVVGELADVLMGGQRATPARLLAAGYAFRFPNIATALADLAASG
jgi:uncharacterized protein (TIGR01777 family)